MGDRDCVPGREHSLLTEKVAIRRSAAFLWSVGQSRHRCRTRLLDKGGEVLLLVTVVESES